MQFRMTRSIDEALDELTQWGDDGCLVAGGTDVVLQYRTVSYTHLTLPTKA